MGNPEMEALKSTNVDARRSCRAQLPIASHLLMWACLLFSANTQSQVAPTLADLLKKSEQPATPSKGSNVAEIRIRIIDSTVLDTLNPKSPEYAVTKKQLEDARLQGAMEKSELALISLRRGLISPWMAKRKTSLDGVVSAGVFDKLAEEEPSALLSLITRGREAGKEESNVAKGEVSFTVPGMSKTVPSSSASRKASRFTLVERGSDNEKRLLSKGGSNPLQGLLPGEEPPRVFIPADPFLPSTPPVSSYVFRVPCEDLDRVKGLTDNRASQLVAAPCGHNAGTSMPVQFDQLGKPSGFSAKPDKAFMARLESILKVPLPSGTPTPVLVVVDDGIPSEEAYQQTKSFLEEADAILVQKHNIDPGWQVMPTKDLSNIGVLPEVKEFPKTTMGPRGKPGCEVLSTATCQFHAKAVANSLEIFTKLVPGAQPVRIVYIPLFFAQKGVAHMAYRFLRFSKVVTDEKPGERLPFNTETQSQLYKDYFALVDERGLGYPALAPDWNVSKAYFNNILQFLRGYSYASGVPVFINLSWRTSADVPSGLKTSGASRVVLVAAAGNPCMPGIPCLGPTNEDLHIGQYNFLQHGFTNDRSTYVVANVDATGNAVCATAKLPMDEAALAFPGGIDDDCGTSFSAPRMAWLMAANERYSTEKFTATYPNQWSRNLRIRVTGERDTGTCVFPDNMACLMPRLEKVFPAQGKRSLNN